MKAGIPQARPARCDSAIIPLDPGRLSISLQPTLCGSRSPSPDTWVEFYHFSLAQTIERRALSVRDRLPPLRLEPSRDPCGSG